MNSAEPTLIFVYNADSGLFDLLADVAHKIFSPQTYSCNLCAITHSNFGMKKEWKTFLETLDAPFEFLHADEFKARYRFKNTQKLPAVFKKEDGELKEIINSDSINACRTVGDLKRLVKTRAGN